MAVFRDLPRGVHEVSSTAVKLDARAVAALSEQGIGGVVEDDVLTLVAATDRSLSVSRAMLCVDGQEPREITVDELRAAVQTGLPFGDAVFDTLNLGFNQDVDERVEAAGDEGAGVGSPRLMAEAAALTAKLQLLEAKLVKAATPQKAKVEPKAAKGKGAKAKANVAWEAAREISGELLAMMESVGLEGHARGLGAAGILSIKALQLHSLAQLEQSLKRPSALGSKFKLSDREREAYMALGVLPAATPEAYAVDAGDATSVDAVVFGSALRDGPLHGAPAVSGSEGGTDGDRKGGGDKSSGHDVLDSCVYASVLLRPAGPELDLELCVDALDEIAAVSRASKVSKSYKKLEAAVDALDLLLEMAVEDGKLTMAELVPPTPGARGVGKHARKLAMMIESRKLTVEPVDKTKDGDMGMIAKIISASNTPRLSEKDEKVAEELAASQARVEAVAKDPRARTALKALAELMESKQDDDGKLETYSKVASEFVDVAALLKSSHVKEPRGEFLALHPHAEECVKHARVARNGVRAAAKAVARKFVPPTADPQSMVEAAFAGILVGDGACTVSTLANGTKAKQWLGVPAASGEAAKAAGTRANLLVLQLKALPLLGYALMVLQPEDQTIAATMMEVMAAFARGVSVRPVAEAVEGLLVPLMRAYADAFDRFQKSATVGLPKMADVWADEKKAPTVLAFLSLVGTAEAGSGAAAAPATGESGEMKALKEKLAKLEKDQRKLSKAMSDVESDGEGDAGKSSRQKAKKERQKARKEERKKAEELADAAPSAAPAAAPAGAPPAKRT